MHLLVFLCLWTALSVPIHLYFQGCFSPQRTLGIKHGRWTDAEIHELSSGDIKASVVLWMFDCAAQQHLVISKNVKYDIIQCKRNFLNHVTEFPTTPHMKVAIKRVMWQFMRWLTRSLCTDCCFVKVPERYIWATICIMEHPGADLRIHNVVPCYPASIQLACCSMFTAMLHDIRYLCLVWFGSLTFAEKNVHHQMD